MTPATQTRDILADHFGVVGVTDDQGLTDDLGADSLGVMELVMELEAAFGIDIPDARMGDIKTTADGVALETCGKCMGSGYGGHPDSGALCPDCNGTGGVPRPAEPAQAAQDWRPPADREDGYRCLGWTEDGWVGVTWLQTSNPPRWFTDWYPERDDEPTAFAPMPPAIIAAAQEGREWNDMPGALTNG